VAAIIRASSMHELALSVLLILLAAPPAVSRRGSDPAPAASRTPGMVLLERVVVAMGGAKAVDGVETLVLRGGSKRALHGKSIDSSRTTWYRFPGYTRTEVSLPSGLTSSSTFTPADAWLESPLGVLRLGEEERRSLEGSPFQNPLSVLKSRKEPGFSVEVVGAGSATGRRSSDLRICHGDGEVAWTVDDADGSLVAARFPARSPGANEGEVAVLYSDYSPAGAGLLYPFTQAVMSNGIVILSIRLDSAVVNEPIPVETFIPTAPFLDPAEAAAPLAGPAASSATPPQPRPR
jgi:hypothetical protein